MDQILDITMSAEDMEVLHEAEISVNFKGFQPEKWRAAEETPQLPTFGLTTLFSSVASGKSLRLLLQA